ncbi:MAG: FKBP-type peptidyl-prolyl cis-trans isomerase [Bacteroidaceae bacterium]|nr:FKBP-type peptidyl-prolyl cis-trans isomerase [Bacteroidaceae bacterium]
MKRYFGFLLTLCVASMFFASCEETEEKNEYANWRVRNQQVIDSIAEVAEANADGKWRIYKAYNLQADDPNDLTTLKDVNDYVYCHVDVAGSGTVSPIYTDSIRTNYRAWYINDVVLDESFKGPLDPEVIVPFESAMSGMIVGWTTALQYMHVGDVWTVYIPYKLAYGTTASNSVPAYSSLKYLINLVGIYPVGTVIPEWQ